MPGDTVLIRLPYDKSGAYTFIPLIAEYFMARGYRVVAQDVRGKFRSEGEPLLFVNEAHDGYDTIEWVTRQRWSNGRVAMWGDSYYGFTQWAAASTSHPALRAIAPRVTGTQLGEPVRVQPGERVSAVEWAVTYLYPVTYFQGQDAFFWDVDWARRPFAAQVEEFFAEVGQRSISYDQWYPRPVHLRRFPDGSPFDAPAVPVLHTIGWWDNCAPLSWADVAAIDERPSWALNHFLRLESMDHESYYLLDAERDRVEERSEEQLRAALPPMLDPALEFFEVFVRGNGSAADIPRVAWNLAGTEGMRASEAWPPMGVRTQDLFATASGGFSPRGSGCRDRGILDARPDRPRALERRNAFAYLLVAARRGADRRTPGRPRLHDIAARAHGRSGRTRRRPGPDPLDRAGHGPLPAAAGRLTGRHGAAHRPRSGSAPRGDHGRGRGGRSRSGRVSASNRGMRSVCMSRAATSPSSSRSPAPAKSRGAAVETRRNEQFVLIGGERPLTLTLSILEGDLS